MQEKESTTYKLTKNGDEITADIQKVLQLMHEKKCTLKEALNVNETFIEEIYSLAYANYEQGKFKEALGFFQILAGISPDEFRFMYGLASCHHQLGDYQEALSGFALSLGLEPLNPMPAFYLGDCYLRLELFAEAREFLSLTIELCRDDEKYQFLKEQAGLILQNLEQKKNGK